MNTKRLTRIALMAAVISVLSPISFPLAGEVPISLATFAVMLAGCVLGPVDGAISAAIYLVLGAIGMPVFASYSSGLGILLGVTGGFLFGYVPLAFFSGLGMKMENKKMGGLIGMVAGNAVLYCLGVIWFMIVTQLSVQTALAACVIPFLIGDCIKMVVVNFVLAPPLLKVIQK